MAFMGQDLEAGPETPLSQSDSLPVMVTDYLLYAYVYMHLYPHVYMHLHDSI